MKILQVTNFFKYAWESGGGVTRVAYDVSRYLAKRGHEVTVFTTEDGLPRGVDIKRNHPITLDGMEVYYFSNASGYLAKRGISLPYLAPFIVRKRLKEFDVIHLHEYRRAILPVVHFYARKYGIPYILQPHNSVGTYFGKRALRQAFDNLWGYNLLKNAARIIAVSQEEAESLKHRGLNGDKITVVYNGMDIDSPAKSPEPGRFKARHDIRGRMILYLGRIHQTKGIDFAIRAFSGLRPEIESLIFIIAGADGGYQATLEALVRELNLGDKVRFVGALSEDDKLSAYTDADLFIHVVKYMGGVGIAPLEAILCGTPVVVTEECGEIVKKADCGYLVKYEDVADLAAKMRRALDNPAEGNEMVARGRKYIYENLTWDMVAGKVEEVYQQTLEVGRNIQ